jgi:hypothetical protein
MVSSSAPDGKVLTRLIAFGIVVVFGFLLFTRVLRQNDTTSVPYNKLVSDAGNRIKAIPNFRTRDEIPAILEKEKLKVGVEVGVQRGHYAAIVLTTWKSCQEYWLVDLWKQQKSYLDYANVDNNEQEQIYKEALDNTKQWPFVKVCRNYTTICAERFSDNYFDWIYVDARHDRKGVLDDLKAYWPKLRAGGLMMGHDYVTQDEIGNQNWTVNYDGTIDHTGLVTRGAIDDFFMTNPDTNPHYRQVVVAYREGSWNSWAVRK